MESTYSNTRRNFLASSLAGLSGLASFDALARRSFSQDRVNLNFSLPPDSLDPSTSSAAANAQVSHMNIFEGLTQIMEDGSAAPLLARSWHSSPDQLHWRFELQPNVHFHDGKALDASCVVTSFLRARAPGSGNKGQHNFFSNFAHINAVGASTVQLELRYPDPHLLFRLGEGSSVILHPDTYQQAKNAPIGTGPYRLKRWQPNEHVALERSPNYWGAAPQIAQAWFYFLDSPAAQLEAIEQGKIDMVFQFFTENLGRFRYEREFNLTHGASSGKGLLAFNHRHPLLSDVRMRRAICHAIDKQNFIDEVFKGNGSTIGSHFSPNEFGYIDLSGKYPHYPEYAMSLLQEVMNENNMSLPVRFKLSVPPTPYAKLGAPLITHHLSHIGVELEIEHLSWPEWLAGPFKGNFDLTIINHVEPLDYGIYTNPNYYFGYDNPNYRALVDGFAYTRNQRQRNLMFAEIQRFLADDAANAWIFNAHISTLQRKGLQGVWVNYPIFVHNIAAMRWVL